MANKVKYGLSNCYYAVYSESSGTYGTPVAMPGTTVIPGIWNSL